MTDETEIDHFDWLPDALAAAGRPAIEPVVERVDLLVAGGVLSGLRWGIEAPRVVLLHGAGQNAHTWDLAVALAGVPALALDLPGHGRSSWREDRDYGPQRNAEAVAEALDAADVRPDAVVGMSLGGLTAFALLGARPELVPSAMIVDVLPGAGGRSVLPAREALGQVALIEGPREFASIDAMLAETARAAPDRPLDDLRRGVVHNATRTPEGRYRWRYDRLDLVLASVPDEALWSAIEGSAAPLLVVRGGASRFVSEDSLGRLARARPDAAVVTVPGAPHAVQSAAPEEIARLLTALLSGR